MNVQFSDGHLTTTPDGKIKIVHGTNYENEQQYGIDTNSHQAD